MLKIVGAIFLILQASPAFAYCTDYEIWKGGDDGLTNQVFDELTVYNQARHDCLQEDVCRTLHLLIPTHVQGIDPGEAGEIEVSVEIYDDMHDRSTILGSFNVRCSLASNNCAEAIFDRADALMSAATTDF